MEENKYSEVFQNSKICCQGSDRHTGQQVEGNMVWVRETYEKVKNYFKFCVSGTGHIKFKLVLKFVHYVGCGKQNHGPKLALSPHVHCSCKTVPVTKLIKNQSMGKHQLFQFAGSGPLHNLGFSSLK